MLVATAPARKLFAFFFHNFWSTLVEASFLKIGCNIERQVFAGWASFNTFLHQICVGNILVDLLPRIVDISAFGEGFVHGFGGLLYCAFVFCVLSF